MPRWSEGEVRLRAVFIRRDDRRLVVQPFTRQPTRNGFAPIARQGRVYVFSAGLSAEHDGDPVFIEIDPSQRRARRDLIATFALARAQRIARRASRTRFQDDGHFRDDTRSDD